MRVTQRLMVAGLAAALFCLSLDGTGLATTAGTAHAARSTDAGPSETISPTRPSRVVDIYKVTGHPKTGGPGQATGAECRAYADAMNGLNDESEANAKNGVDNGQVYETWDGIKKAGGARGCIFLQAF